MTKSTDRKVLNRLLAGAAPLALSLAAFSSPAHAIVPNDNVGPEDAVDNDDNFRGVGMFFRNDGFVCTGTLINPRTVLFAAHCVNNVDQDDYNENNLRSAFSFNVNALPGFINWINNNFSSNPDLAVYNINRIFYNQDSLTNPGAQGFLEADIALASLDTPAADIPTWALLFSPLPTPEEITDETGTGYHVNITGYGRSGTGSTGDSQGIDWRRRSAENFVGALTSFDERNTFLFGAPFGNLPQSLYRLDFDDPNKTNPFDFNLYKDEPLEREGTTAGGDSGGPLILDAANNTLSEEDLVIGVLSGGSRFFGPQGFSTYGTESFYQPLYLFWDYIAAVNPYRYVTAKAGDGKWESSTHWETTLDPAYRIINANGDVVNGIPTSPGAGITGGSPDFGEVCFDTEGDNPGDGCQDLSTGDNTPPARNIGEGVEIVSGIGSVSVDLLNGLGISNIGGRDDLNGDDFALAVQAQSTQANGIEFALEEAQGSDGGAPEFSADPLPAPTLANGLPGASGFVPNNIDPVITGDPETNVDPRYFDVTLANAGTTTLDSTVVIDRLTVRGPANLNIRFNGDLTSLIDISQFGGTINVDNALTSVGDYTIFGGMLSGNGTVTAPFVTNLMGAISPGQIGTVDTLTIDGSAVLSSASTLLIDIGPNGTSDTLAVTGDVSVGGIVALGTGIAGVVNGTGTQYTIVTAGGGILDANGDPLGTFNEGTISAILSQSFTYEENAVLMSIDAASYSTVIDGTDPVQVAFAQLLDQNRGNSALGDLYALDFFSASDIQSQLANLAPTAETGVRSLTAQTFTHMFNFHDRRLRTSRRSSAGGTIATLGNPLGTAEAGLARYSSPQAGIELGLQSDGEPTNVQEGAVPENMALYVAGGFMNGDGEAMPGFQAAQTDFDGYFLAGGVELFPSDNSVLGFSVYHSDIDSDTALAATADSKIWAGTVYGRVRTASGIAFDGQLSVSDYDVSTQRTVAFANTQQTLSTNDDSSGLTAALGVSYDIETGAGTISPGVGARYARVGFDRVNETGGFAGLTIDRETYKSFQGRAGLEFASDQDSTFKLGANAHYVHEFEDGPQLFNSNFVGGTGPAATFALAGTDQDWFEVGVSASVNAGPVEVGVGFDSTIGRDNAEAQTYSASATIRF